MRRLIYTFIVWCLMASPVWAAITFDTASTGTGSTSSSHSHTFAADSNIAIVCLAMREDTGAVQSASAVTVGGASATFLAGSTNNGNVIRAELWYKLGPSTGAQTVAVTANASTDDLVTGVMSFKSVAQTSTFNTSATAQNNGVTASMDVTSIASAVGEMGVYCGAARTATTTASADAASPVSTERFEASTDQQANNSGIVGFGYTEDGAATSIDMLVDLSATVQAAAAAVSMRPLASTRRSIAPIIFP